MRYFYSFESLEKDMYTWKLLSLYNELSSGMV